jgi:hypothetical protein
MIVSASIRTDIPAFFGEWFSRRLAAGWCLVPNPVTGQPMRVDLVPPRCDGLVFWTKDVRPFLPALAEVAALGLPFTLQHTVTGYPRAYEPAVPLPADVLPALREVVARHGPHALAWRYDPIVLSTATPDEWHLANFAQLAAMLEGLTDQCTVSFVHPYPQTCEGLSEAGMQHRFDMRVPDTFQKRRLLGRLAEIARAHGMRTATCAQPDLAIEGVEAARCVDVERLSRMAGRLVNAPVGGNRRGCGCARSADIGEYGTCRHGCVYCYARRGKPGAHDPAGESLTPLAGTVQAPGHRTLPLFPEGK